MTVRSFAVSRLRFELVALWQNKLDLTNKIVVEVAKSLNVSISPDDISTSHRLPVSTKRGKNDDSTSAPIIGLFSRDVRNKIYANRKFVYQLDMKKIEIKGTTNPFINENLTLLRKRLFWKTKQKVKEAGGTLQNLLAKLLDSQTPYLLANFLKAFRNSPRVKNGYILHASIARFLNRSQALGVPQLP